MRIQHNIAALNSHRQLTNNNSSVAKNLEKLSSGYRINRAGDDAAGLAISEKMRAQITGLNTASKNAQDGISLVQTAEGALTEVHSMLNRMTELADQSANGTYQDSVDRENIQKELDSLRSEIDRISEGTNFNGINLLDGSLGGSAGGAGKVNVKYAGFADNPGALTTSASTAANTTIAAGTTTTLSTQTETTLEITFSDANGTLQTKNVTFTAATGTMGHADNDAILAKAFKDAFGDGFAVSSTNGALTITANDSGSSNKFKIFSIDAKDDTGAALTNVSGAVVNTKGEDSFNSITDDIGVFDGTGDASKSIFEVNGQKFAYVTDEAAAKKLGADVNYRIVANNTSIAAADTTALVSMINVKTGIAAEAGQIVGTDDTTIHLKAGDKASSTGNGLVLQIGDTAESFNQLTVSVGKMNTSALGIANVDVSTQAGAKAAIKNIKDAINTVSSTRGDLGAIQNRLEHTINNLGVTAENMTAAESRIRDVDMAQEMMNFTKNNILTQASQAMLAQANQLPQGVLQLLQ